MTRALSSHAADSRPGGPRGRSNERSRATPSARDEPVVTALEQETIQEALARLPRRRRASSCSSVASSRTCSSRRAHEFSTSGPPSASISWPGIAPATRPWGWSPGTRPCREASRYSGRRPPRSRSCKARAEAPIRGRVVDLVSAISVLEHTHDPERVFAEAHRVLRPSGGFYFYTTSAICSRQSEIRSSRRSPRTPIGPGSGSCVGRPNTIHRSYMGRQRRRFTGSRRGTSGGASTTSALEGCGPLVASGGERGPRVAAKRRSGSAGELRRATGSGRPRQGLRIPGPQMSSRYNLSISVTVRASESSRSARTRP